MAGAVAVGEVPEPSAPDVRAELVEREHERAVRRELLVGRPVEVAVAHAGLEREAEEAVAPEVPRRDGEIRQVDPVHAYSNDKSNRGWHSGDR